MRPYALAAGFWLATCTTAHAAAPCYAPVLEKSRLKFVALQNSSPVEGAFAAYSARICLDPDKPDESTITAEVDVGSVFTAHPDVAKQLVGADWFNVAEFPKATFRTLQIYMLPPRENDDRRYYYADAELTLRGKTAPVTLNFVLERYTPEDAVASGRVTLLRSEYGVGQGEWKSSDVVEDAVSVSMRVVAKRIAASD